MTLKTEDRPDNLNYHIDLVFNHISKDNSSNWMWNGVNENYQIAFVDETAMMVYLIKQNPTKSDFYFLDLGAGNFGVSDNLVSQLNQLANQGTISNSIKIHIYGVRGEKALDQAPVQNNGICVQYNIGNFKIEELKTEFDNRQMSDIKFDFIISHYTIGHLIDPLGTITQAHQVLNKGGFFLFDNAPFSINDLYEPNNLLKFLYTTNEPFIVSDALHGKMHFLIQKENENLNDPFSYTNILKHAQILKGRDFGGMRANYQVPEDNPIITSKLQIPSEAIYTNFFGNCELLESLTQGEVFFKKISPKCAGEIFIAEESEL
jgi:SAM-dependent methyltransferase